MSAAATLEALNQDTRAQQSGQRRLSPLVYCLIIMLPPLALLFSAIPIARSKSFLAKAPDPYVQILDYPFTLGKKDCEVVVFGDSTAMTGISPALLSQSTGLKVCSLTRTRNTLKMSGTLALDKYLAENRAPKFIVFQLGVDTFWSDDNIEHYEGITDWVRHDARAAIFWKLALHPQVAVDYMIWVLRTEFIPDRRPAIFKKAIEDFRASGGLLTLPKPPQKGCVATVANVFDHPYHPNAEWIRSLRGKYAKDGTRVLVNVSPVPDCSPRIGYYETELNPLVNNRLEEYPTSLFNDLNRHYTRDGAARLSREVAAELISLSR